MKWRSFIIVLGIAVYSFGTTPAMAQFEANFGSLFGVGSGSGQLSPIPQFGTVAPGVGGLFAGLSLIAAPQFPDPYESFAIELSAPDESYSGSLIKWYINGVEDLSARNKRQHTLTAGGLGEAMTIRVTLEKRDGTVDETSLTITPVIIDVVLEARTTVPHFYEGRALPSRGSNARATAVIHTKNTPDRDSLTYRWELNGTVLEAGSIRGLTSVDFEMPLSFESYLDVTISDSNGVIGSKSVRITPTEPSILFYEDNPLLGTIEAAFPRRKTVVGNQITIRGEPYYLDQYERNTNFLTEWKLSNRPVDTSNETERNVITLRSDGSTSRGNVVLRMADLSKLSEMTSGSFFLTFGY